ncbi:hypothetical protein [Natronomonas marina]|jgi:hypothetical protein|uniref:hypothetical protein n=1 Tax=Natronomonas marina TaxID=2961939 RepID=UPI0020C954F8|nr:hypothetical protein [Natronomonas marina]
MSHAPGDEHGPFAGHLRDGERLTDEFRVGSATVGVTDRRLLVARETGTPAVRAVDRTNVGAIRERTLSDRGLVLSALLWAGLGAFLLAAWRFAPLSGFLAPVDVPPGTGFDDLFAAVNALVGLLQYVDEAFLVAGLLALVWAGFRAVGYVRERRTVLEVTVAGADPVRLPSPDDPTAVDRLRGAVSAPPADGSG